MASSSKTNCRPSTESVVRFWVDPADSDDDKSSVDEDEDEISEEEEEEREWTEEETLLYRRALKESEGFDLPELPYNGKLGGITRIRAHSLSLPCHRKCAEVAINYYNSHNGTNFEFVEVEKACSQIVCGCMFYLTLKVRPAGMPAHYPTTCLQAKVLYGIDNIQTRLCRIKPDPSSAGKKSSPQCSSGTNCSNTLDLKPTKHSADLTVEAMMLDSQASNLDKEERPEVLSLLPHYEGRSVLELGAGIGRFTGELALKVSQLIALDFIENAIKKNESINSHHKNVKFLCADVTSPELGISDESIDLIFSNI